MFLEPRGRSVLSVHVQLELNMPKALVFTAYMSRCTTYFSRMLDVSGLHALSRSVYGICPSSHSILHAWFVVLEVLQTLIFSGNYVFTYFDIGNTTKQPGARVTN